MKLHAALIGTILRLRLKRVAADRANLIWLIAMPLIFSFIMGQLMGSWSQGPATQYQFVVFGAGDSGEVAAELVAALAEHEEFTLVVRDSTASRARIREIIDAEGIISGALRFDAGFADSLAAGLAPTVDFFYDGDRGSSQRMRRALEPVFAAHAARLAARQMVDPEAALDDPGKAAAFDAARFDSLVADPRVRLEAEALGRTRGSDLMLSDSRQHSGPSYTLMFILMFLLMSAKDLVQEQKQRTLDRLRMAWPSTGDLVLGFFLAGMVVGLLQATVLLGINAAIFDIDYGPSPATLVLVIVLFVGVSSAAGLLLGTLSRSGGQADGLGMVFGLGLPAVGGLWWPLEIVPPFMQTIGRALPTGQAITVFHDMIGRGWGIAENTPMLLGLAAWLLVLLGLATFFFRRTVNP